MRLFDAAAILFDLDGTLIDSTDASEWTWRRWATKHRVPIEHIRAVHHGRLPADTIRLVAPHLDALEQAGLIYAEQETLTQGIRLIPGAGEFYGSVPLDRVAIVTAATSPVLRARLALVGLEMPAVFVTGEAVTAGKPDPEGYLAAARRIGVPPDRCIVFEDAPPGLIAAHRAGIAAVAVLSNYTEAALQLEVGDAAMPVAFITDFCGITYDDGRVRLPD